MNDQLPPAPMPDEDEDTSPDFFGLRKILGSHTAAARLAEIRRGLDGLDDLEVRTIYFTAPPEVREALESGPARIRKTRTGFVVEPWISEEHIATRRAGAAAARDPAAVAHLRALQGQRQSYEMLGNVLIERMRAAVPLGPGDARPIKTFTPGRK